MGEWDCRVLMLLCAVDLACVDMGDANVPGISFWTVLSVIWYDVGGWMNDNDREVGRKRLRSTRVIIGHGRQGGERLLC